MLKYLIMRKILFFIIAFIISGSVMSQSRNLVIFHEDGEKFIVFLNGMKKNDAAKSNVKMTGLKADFFKVKIEFENNSLGSFKKSLWLEDNGMEYTFNIHQRNNGKMTLRPVSQTEITELTSTDEYEDSEKYEDPQQSGEGEVNEGHTTVTHSETYTTEGNPRGRTESASVKMKVSDSGMDVSVEDKHGGADVNVDFDVEGETTHTTTTTTTTSSSSSSYDDDSEKNVSTTTTTYSGNCEMPISEGDFQEAVSSINSKSFADSKMTVAKQVAKNECLTTSNVKEIIKIFNFEEKRIEFAKYAYDYVYNPNKYYKVNDVFDYESSIEELNEYIESKD